MSITATPESRRRLAAIRERTHTARAQRTQARQTLDAARATDDIDAAVIAEGALNAAQVELETAERLEAMLLSQLAGVDGHGVDGGFLDDPEAMRQLELIAHSSAPVGNVVLGRFQSAEQFASTLGRAARWAESGGNGAGGDVIVPDSARAQAPLGIVRQVYRPLHLLDLIPTQVMTGGSFSYLIESGDFDEGAAETEEGAVKPEGAIDLQEGEVRAVTIASWVKARRQSLDDVSDLQTTISQRLSYLVQRRAERQVLAGDGQGEHILGILDRDGLMIVDGAGMPAADAILRGLTAVRLGDASPTGVVLNPLTYEALLTEKDGSGSRLDSSGAFSGGTADTVWGIPVVQSSVVGEDRAVVADWSRAATLYVREGLTIRISDSDQDDFIRNRVTILAETRVGLMVAVPSAIAVVQLGES